MGQLTNLPLGAYVNYFNKSRDAHIKGIRELPEGGICIYYENGSEIVADVWSYVQLFDKLEALHPKP